MTTLVKLLYIIFMAVAINEAIAAKVIGVSWREPWPGDGAIGRRTIAVNWWVDAKYMISIKDRLEYIYVETVKEQDGILRGNEVPAKLKNALSDALGALVALGELYKEGDEYDFVVRASDGRNTWGLSGPDYSRLDERNRAREAVETLKNVVWEILSQNEEEIEDHSRVVEGNNVTPRNVTWLQIADNPERWDGKRVRIRSQYVTGDNDSLYPANMVPDAEEGIRTRRIVLDWEFARPGRRGGVEEPWEVWITGTFNCADQVLRSQFVGTLVRITAFERMEGMIRQDR